MTTRRALALVLAALTMVVTAAGPAWAHAELLETVPADGALLDRAPRDVVLRFSEPVSIALGGVTVTAPDGDRVRTGRVSTRAGRREVVVPLPADVPQGTLLLTWRVVSADSHPVAGALTFSIGRETPVGRAPAATSTGIAGALLTGARLLCFAGLVLLLGGVMFVAAVWRSAPGFAVVRRLLWGGWACLVTGTTAGLLLHGPYAAGEPLRAVFDPTLLGSVLGTRYGVAGVARLLLLAVTAGLVATVTRTAARPGRRVALAAAVTAAGVLTTLSSVGHASAGHLATVAVPLDSLHLAAVSAWVGGLVVLAVVLLRRADPAQLVDVLPRWSRYAATAVGVLVATGGYASWREVREAAAVTGTPYGRMLLVKTALVAGMLGLAAVGRSVVRRHVVRRPADSLDVAVRRLRRTVALETGAAGVVLAVTSSLVATTPARNSYAPVFRASASVHEDLRVAVEIAPARAGVNHFRLDYLTPAGRPVDVAETTVRFLAHGSADVLPVRLDRTGSGRHEQHRLVLPHAGTWQFEVVTRTSDIDSYTTRLSVRIR